MEKIPCDTVSPVTREQLRRDSRALSRRLAERGPWTGICSIARERDIRLMDTVRISRYDGQWRDRTSAPKRPAAPEGCGGAGWLPVDGLGDAWRTARLVRELPPGARFATVHAKPAGRPLVDAGVTEVGQDAWSLFPWDSATQFVPPIAKARG